ncbi:MAG: M15 family metallopeptidase [Mogibacterium sp.]|nr:M15 family metallopeptidase [Mogibacterium sp.]
MSRTKKFLILDLILVLAVAGTYFGFKFLKNDEPDAYEVADNIKSGAEDLKEIESAAEEELKSKELDEWYLILVNPDNAMPEGMEVETASTESGHEVDARVKEPLEEMLAACREAGYSPQIISAFRTRETQQYLYDTTANKNDTAKPGHSEHECGLAIDIIDSSSAGWADPLIDEQEELPAQIWLMENCQDYGFILRYPKDKEDITQIIYEPWHYRYVGKEHATKIMESGVCLEEYIEELKGE